MLKMVKKCMALLLLVMGLGLTINTTSVRAEESIVSTTNQNDETIVDEAGDSEITIEDEATPLAGESRDNVFTQNAWLISLMFVIICICVLSIYVLKKLQANTRDNIFK